MYKKSAQLFTEAKKYMPGGVNSPVRAFKSVNMEPLFIKRALGSKIYDADGSEYIDYVASWGPLILGHAHPEVVKAVTEAAKNGTSYGASTEIEIELAKLITEIYPSIDKVRMVNSGTEAAMSAVRIARGFTGRDKIIKFDGCYHGHSDSFLIKAGSGALTLGIPGNPGVTKGTASDTLIAGYNTLESVQEIIEANPGQIAAIIVEPVAGNAGVIPPAEDFLEGLRKLAADNGIILIFDEVITGFRVALGGAQELYGVKPDMTCLGKIIGGGLPVGAYGGRADIMDMVAPDGPVYQAGTLAGNPLAMAAGLAAVNILKEENPYPQLDKMASLLADGIRECSVKHGIPIQQNRVGSMMCRFFTDKPVTGLDSAMTSDTELFAEYFKAMLSEGIYMAPSQFEAGFVSTAHTAEDIEKTIEAHDNALKKIG
ncbi:glutamate-1-semialdehyde aminotransferase [bacterium SM23_31]|nr:MAG: glutamate-1-semialdehyde aminotransferase [bacterium SM23_31]